MINIVWVMEGAGAGSAVVQSVEDAIGVTAGGDRIRRDGANANANADTKAAALRHRPSSTARTLVF